MSIESTTIEARFEGGQIIDYGVATIPHLLINHYRDLGFTDGHYTLMSHIVARKWTASEPFPTLNGLRMSAQIQTRRSYVRDFRRLGLLYTRRLYWTNEDLSLTPQARPGRVRSNRWYLATLFTNLVGVHEWLRAGKDLRDLTSIEVPQVTVELLLSDEFHDTPEDIDMAIRQACNDAGAVGPVVLLLEKPILEALLCKNPIVGSRLLFKKLLLEKPIVIKKKKYLKKNNHHEDDEIESENDQNGDQQPETKEAQIIGLYENNIAVTMGQITRDEMMSSPYIDCPILWWQQAFGIATANNARRWSYIRTVLEGAIEHGVEPKKVPLEWSKTRPSKASGSNGMSQDIQAAMLARQDLDGAGEENRADPLWDLVINQLSNQMARATFDTWVKDAIGIIDNDSLVVWVKSAFAKDWLENRLHTIVKRTAESVYQKQLRVQYQVRQGE